MSGENGTGVRRAHPIGVVVMGVSGTGKSSVGAALAEQMSARFIEGDALHPVGNVEWMRAGRALDDVMRAPWLLRVGQALDAAIAEDGVAVASCSALKRRYRNDLRTAVRAPLLFVWLTAPPGVLERRIAARSGHYMPASLLASQFADLEPPAPDERCLLLANAVSAAEAAAEALSWIEAGAPPPQRHAPLS